MPPRTLSSSPDEVRIHSGARALWPARRMCNVLQVHPSGFSAWQQTPTSERAKDDQRIFGLIKQSWLERGVVYGYRKITCDLCDLGEACGKLRVARLMRSEGLRSKTGYGRRPGGRAGKPSDGSPNHLRRQVDVQEPNKVWVPDITYLRAHEGWLFLPVVRDLFSRQIIGWSMHER